MWKISSEILLCFWFVQQDVTVGGVEWADDKSPSPFLRSRRERERERERERTE